MMVAEPEVESIGAHYGTIKDKLYSQALTKMELQILKAIRNDMVSLMQDSLQNIFEQGEGSRWISFAVLFRFMYRKGDWLFLTEAELSEVLSCTLSRMCDEEKVRVKWQGGQVRHFCLFAII
ncbi:unnamed protein product [Amoebophrya sp. A25]|nr:unnamed protein product [Amoebophrya sp. A25]|eukprot:GSA25T00026695001.1